MVSSSLLAFAPLGRSGQPFVRRLARVMERERENTTPGCGSDPPPALHIHKPSATELNVSDQIMGLEEDACMAYTFTSE